VTGSAGGGVVDGQAYDMVIPVEIELPGGVKKLEIGYNQGQNPFTVAQEFIDKHMLDQNYLREIADYITQRSSEYRAPVLGNDEEVNFSGSSASAPAAQPMTPQYKYFPVVSGSFVVLRGCVVIDKDPSCVYGTLRSLCTPRLRPPRSPSS